MHGNEWMGRKSASRRGKQEARETGSAGNRKRGKQEAREMAEGMMSLPRACELLRVSQDASKQEIESAYRHKMRDVHPDKSGHPHARQRTLDVQKAKEVLLQFANGNDHGGFSVVETPWRDLVLPAMTFAAYNYLKTEAEKHERWRYVLEQFRDYFPKWIAAGNPHNCYYRQYQRAPRAAQTPQAHERPRPPPGQRVRRQLPFRCGCRPTGS